MITINDIMDSLPKDDSHNVWSNGEDILCTTENEAEKIADTLELLGIVESACTGYFNPDEDVRNNEVDNSTGWYFVHESE